MTTSRRTGKRGRKPAKVDVKAKLERSRQSARECRARKKLRYQYLEELVTSREKAIYALRKELEMCKQWCMTLDKGKLPPGICETLEMERKRGLFADDERKIQRTKDWCELTLESSDEDDSCDSECTTQPETERGTTALAKTCVVTAKGKGQGKVSLKQTTDTQPRSNNAGQSVSVDQSILSEAAENKNDVAPVKSVTTATASPFALDTAALDTPTLDTPTLDTPTLDTGTSVDVLPPSVLHHPVASQTEGGPSTGITGEFPTINPLDLLPVSNELPDVNPAPVTMLINPDQIGFDVLSEAEISDVLEVIEKQYQS